MSVTIKSEHEIELMREAGRILAAVHQQLGKEIDAKIEDWYNTIFGTAPLRRDGTGRQIEPAI